MSTDQAGCLAKVAAHPLSYLMMPFMRWATVLLSLLCLFAAATHAKPASKLPRADLVNIMVGDYVVVGKKPDSQATYTGRVTFRSCGDKLAFTRTVDRKTVRGIATLEMTVIGDPAPVLRMHFVQDGRRLEATFQWMFDLDNYARFTGYVYRANSSTTRAAGLEMLFPLLPSVRD